jgi:hypothetical protein
MLEILYPQRKEGFYFMAKRRERKEVREEAKNVARLFSS